MLVLARKLSEAICIGDDVRIVIVEIRGNRVRLGVEAPRHIRVRRDEVESEPATEPMAADFHLCSAAHRLPSRRAALASAEGGPVRRLE